jgi:hypothetical protein
VPKVCQLLHSLVIHKDKIRLSCDYTEGVTLFSKVSGFSSPFGLQSISLRPDKILEEIQPNARIREA